MEIEELIKLIREGNLAAFACLVEQYQRVAIARAMRYTNDFHWAQDVAQDSLVVAFNKIGLSPRISHEFSRRRKLPARPSFSPID